jgi:anti-sigma factor RsiW
MNCVEIRELLSGQLDGELSGHQERLVTGHLKECARCADELSAFAAISNLAKSLPNPTPPPDVWEGLQRQLDGNGPVERTTRVLRDRSALYRLLALAATVILCVGVFTWLFPPFGRHHHETAHFGRFMEAFASEPEAAQRMLLVKYSGRAATKQELTATLKYTPAGIDSAPAGYTVVESYLLDMPCCRCSQVVYRRNDGGFLALFEHDTQEQPDLFGDCPCVNTECNGNPCTLVQTANHITASCEVGGRHFTVVGARNFEEVQAFVAWLESETKARAASV